MQPPLLGRSPPLRRRSSEHGQRAIFFHWPPPGSLASSGSGRTIPLHRVSKRLFEGDWPGRFRPSLRTLPLKQSSSQVSSTPGFPVHPTAVPRRFGYALRGTVSGPIASVRSLWMSCPDVLAMLLHRARRARVRKGHRGLPLVLHDVTGTLIPGDRGSQT